MRKLCFISLNMGCSFSLPIRRARQVARTSIMLNTVGEDHRFDSLKWRINDFLDVEVHDARPSEVKFIDALNHVLPLTNALIVTAIAVKRDGVAALLRDLVAKHPYPDNVAMFDSMENARAWIEQRLQSVSAAIVRGTLSRSS